MQEQSNTNTTLQRKRIFTRLKSHIPTKFVKMAGNAKYVNPDAEVVAKSQALQLNCAAANGLQMVLRSNLGAPRLKS